MTCKIERAFNDNFAAVSTNTGLSLNMNLFRIHVFRNIGTRSETAVSSTNGV
jgi:hypothetical protein